MSLIYYLTRTVERNILEPGITPRALKVRLKSDFFLLGYLFTREFVGVLDHGNYERDKDGKRWWKNRV